MVRPLVVVIDSASAFLELMHEILTDQGYRAILWHTGQGAFDLILKEQPNLVILDLWLEHPNAGEMVLGLMQMDPATKHIPVLICSTREHLVERKAAFLDGQYDIIIKPFDLDELQAKIAERLQRE